MYSSFCARSIDQNHRFPAVVGIGVFALALFDARCRMRCKYAIDAIKLLFSAANSSFRERSFHRVARSAVDNGFGAITLAHWDMCAVVLCIVLAFAKR